MSNTAGLPLQIRDWIKEASTPWLQTGNGERFMYTIGLMSDVLLDKANQASKIGMPGQGDVSQLPYLAEDRGLTQGPAEPDASFVIRLQQAPEAWKEWGSRLAVLGQLQGYLTALQPGVPSGNIQAAIVSSAGLVSAWSWITFAMPQGAPPNEVRVLANYNWDDRSIPWRSFLILPMVPVAVGLSGSAATIGAASGTTKLGSNVSGVWTAGGGATVGTSNFYTITGLSDLTTDNVGQWLELSGAASGGNNGTFPITQVLSSSSCVVANPNGVTPDANSGSISWSVVAYPYIGPGMPWGSANLPAWNNGVATPSQANTTPGLSTPTVGAIGQLVGAAWLPATNTGPTPTSLGLACNSAILPSIRGIVQKWKSGTTWYRGIWISFGGGSGAPGTEFSPYSAQGSGNPAGTYGSPGVNTNGVWVPAQLGPVSPYSALCQGSAFYSDCSVENVN